MIAIGMPGAKVRLFIGLRRVAEQQRQDGEVLVDAPGILMNATISADGASLVPAEAGDGD